MYYPSYEEYMRSVLGYPTMGSASNFCSCDQPSSFNPYATMQANTTYENAEVNLEQFYPKLYFTIMPSVNRVCNGCNPNQLSQARLDEMVDSIYRDVCSNEEILLQFNLKVESRANEKTSTKTESRSEVSTSRQRSSNALRDLIRILILQQLLQNRPPRPPFPGGPGGPRPPRPPFPGGPGPGPRPY